MGLGEGLRYSVITCLSFLYSTRGLFGRVECDPAFFPSGHFVEFGVGYEVFGGNEVIILIVFGGIAGVGTTMIVASL